MSNDDPAGHAVAALASDIGTLERLPMSALACDADSLYDEYLRLTALIDRLDTYCMESAT